MLCSYGTIVTCECQFDIYWHLYCLTYNMANSCTRPFSVHFGKKTLVKLGNFASGNLPIWEEI